ncbi:mandelate racemase [Pseudonocardia sulfidoxydans NBRC 16205]|uniref:Mandelate racemase n=1 Tax=Pseudonocardia sulfidoxydans NBRC 16205 TaxID=1223511 RepID=A0A511DLG3_9PSEU|nr:enolase C-terminal domain-like protein [Pseudonocardia sulfidoxydans]GEL25103.1 mandelate racemase [Pseudonocardia sulfidoxydans NBRC 16205]
MSSPVVRDVEARLVRVPMRRPLHTSASRVTDAPLLLVDVHTEDGPTGRCYLFCYLDAVGRAAAAITRSLGEGLVGTPAEPAAVRAQLADRTRLVGASGVVGGVLAALDVACWDVVALAAGVPLARLLGARPVPVPAYNSNGLGLVDPATAADEAVELAGEGFRAVKMRLGRADPDSDVAAVRAVRRALGDDVGVMADFNQALSRATARERCRALDDEGLTWIEEPVRHDDHAGAADLAATLRTPVQLGENLAGPRDAARAVSAGVCDLLMVDLDRIGGVTGWSAAAALADQHAIPLSSHLYPEVSAHLLAASPTAHWLEYVDWAEPVLLDPAPVADGAMSAPERPGTGLVWDEEAVARYRIG